MRSHRCQQRHHKECTIGPRPNALVVCECSCHTGATIGVNTLVNPTPVVKGCPGHKTAFEVWPGVYAGAKTDSTPIPLGCIILDLADNIRPMLRVEGFDIPGVGHKRVVFDWPDMGKPGLTRDQWERLAQGLKSQGEPVYVACMGGHGRTGTCLAILGCLWGLVPDGTDPVAWLRSHYDAKLVETQGQCDYVAQITGRTVKVGPAAHDYQGATYHPKPEWVEGTPLHLCKWAKGNHNGCDKYGHELDKKLPNGWTDATKTISAPLTFATRCPECLAYGGHFKACTMGGSSG